MEKVLEFNLFTRKNLAFKMGNGELILIVLARLVLKSDNTCVTV